ncbi:MAG: diacylglycerol kinase (ATP) [Actinobacteria bacterium]|jgi:diacylglycerol kinase (ATP)|nr:diacylglycerol kinase (ATP) [Actinomycetota bacterium]
MWALVINPTAGSGKGASIGSHVAGFLTQRDQAHEIVSGDSAISLITHLKRFIENHPDCQGVIAVGGDGLLHNVLQVVTPAQIPLAVIPAGTGNDFVRTLGWPLENLNPYLENIITKRPRPMDLGLVDGEWFGAILSTGFDSIVNEKANTMSWPKGPMKYNVAIAIELPRFAPRNYEITLDDRSISTQAMLIAVSNGRSYGGGMLVCPDADIHDGLFDVMVLHPVSKIEFIKVFPRVFKGTHVNHPAVEIVRSKKVTIVADAVAYSDGERLGRLPISAECIPGVLQTWIP